MITKIEVKGLFGAFHHKIRLKEEGVTLILGDNGLGKTVILRILKAFFERDFLDLKANIFTDFIITFSNRETVTIKRVEKKEALSLSFTLSTPVSKKKEAKRKTPYSISFPLSNDKLRDARGIHTHQRYYDEYHMRDLLRFLPFPAEQVGPDRWMDRRRNEVLSTSDLLERYSDFLPPPYRDFGRRNPPEWLVRITDSIKVKLIETQRLLTQIKTDEDKYRQSAESYSKELVEQIKNRRIAATDLASKLDRNFPNRLITKTKATTVASEEELQISLGLLEKKRQLLMEVGLLDAEEEFLQPVTLEQQKRADKSILGQVLQIYIDDSNQKLAIYDDIAKRIELLMAVINKRFLYKKLTVNKTQGFLFKSILTGKDIPVAGLSSGEQHELVLFFQLLFKADSGSLILIDEPEISLHISWQKQFINDLSEAIKLSSLTAIIATHSPDIIGNYWNLTVNLNGAADAK